MPPLYSEGGIMVKTLGTVSSGEVEEIIVEDKVTIYRLHPNQKEYFGLIQTAPNQPNIHKKLVEKSKKGWRLNPQNLAPDCKIEADPCGGLWAVPEGWEIIGVETPMMVEDRDGKLWQKDTDTTYKLAEKGTKAETAPKFVCDICGKECASEFGLKAHRKVHK